MVESRGQRRLQHQQLPLRIPSLWRVTAQIPQLTVEVNVTLLRHLIVHGVPIPYRDILKNLPKEVYDRYNIGLFSQSDLASFDRSITPDGAVAAIQPDGLSVKLYDYQLKCLGWMQDLELGNRTISFSPCLPLLDEDPTFESDIFVDHRMMRFSIGDRQVTTKFKGGELLRFLLS